MSGYVALVGGDEFRTGCEAMDRTILDATGQSQPTVLVIPTAAAQQNPSKAASTGCGYFSNLGAETSALMVLDTTQASDPELLAPIDSTSVLYFTGGNPRHLLSVLQESLLLQKLKSALARGAIVAGSSAGAMVLGSWIRFRDWKEALGIVEGVAISPHHERIDPSTFMKQFEIGTIPNLAILGIDTMACCFNGPSGWRVIGRGAVTLYLNGTLWKFEPGQQVPIPTPE